VAPHLPGRARIGRDTLPDRPTVAGSECEAKRPGEGQACCAAAWRIERARLAGAVRESLSDHYPS